MVTTLISSAFEDDFELRSEVLAELEKQLAEAGDDTRAALSSFIPNADSFQMAVIKASDHTIRLVAPAGSGKTQTIVQRVLSRIQGGVKPERILLLTFDRAAATSIRSALSA